MAAIDHVDGGAYLTARAIFDNEIWLHPTQYRLFEYIRGNAVFAPAGCDICGIHVPRGSYLASYRKLAEGTKWIEKNQSIRQYSLSTVKEATDALIIKGRLTKVETGVCTMWTVTNYNRYQDLGNFGARVTEGEYRTPPDAKTNNATGGQLGSADELPNAVTERHPNKNKNDGTRLIALAEKFLAGKKIKFSRYVLQARMSEWLALYDSEVLSEAMATAAHIWVTQAKEGNFLQYLRKILENDYPQLSADAEDNPVDAA